MSTGNWFVTRPGWSYQEDEMVQQIARQTESRVYYGEVKAPNSYRRRPKQKYWDKDNCLAIGVDEETARSIRAAWIHARQKSDRAKERCRAECREIDAHRDAKITELLAQGMEARSGETALAGSTVSEASGNSPVAEGHAPQSSIPSPSPQERT